MSNRPTARIFYGVCLPWNERKENRFENLIKKEMDDEFRPGYHRDHFRELLVQYGCSAEWTNWDYDCLVVYVRDTLIHMSSGGVELAKGFGALPAVPAHQLVAGLIRYGFGKPKPGDVRWWLRTSSE